MPPELLYEMERVDLTKVVADRDAIRKVNPQRFEMEQLDAIVFLDTTIQIIVGYKDARLFARNFKTAYGKNPTEYRNEHASE